MAITLTPARRNILSLLAATAAALLLAGCGAGVAAQAAFHRLPPRVSKFAAIPTILNTQARALARGDEPGWLAPVDATKPELVQRYRDLFRSMHSIGVLSLTPVINADVSSVDSGPLTLGIIYAYCIQVPACPTSNLDLGVVAETIFTQLTFTEQGDRVLISKFDLVSSPTGSLGRAPWIDANLTFASGTRATVIASAGLSRRLPAALAAADAAATVTDRYARWVWPVRYIVYLAGPAEWSAWLARFPGGDNIVAYATSPSTSSEVVVVNMAVQDRNADPLVSVLRHEFGHVVTLLGVNRNLVGGMPRLFVEGIAEYIAEDGRPLGGYAWLQTARRLIHSGRWNGDLDSVEQFYDSARPDDVRAAYGMGFLTWRCIASRYGQEKLLDFAEHIFRNMASNDTAATKAFGEPWPTVNAACATYLRRA